MSGRRDRFDDDDLLEDADAPTQMAGRSLPRRSPPPGWSEVGKIPRARRSSRPPPVPVDSDMAFLPFDSMEELPVFPGRYPGADSDSQILVPVDPSGDRPAFASEERTPLREARDWSESDDGFIYSGEGLIPLAESGISPVYDTGFGPVDDDDLEGVPDTDFGRVRAPRPPSSAIPLAIDTDSGFGSVDDEDEDSDIATLDSEGGFQLGARVKGDGLGPQGTIPISTPRPRSGKGYPLEDSADEAVFSLEDSVEREEGVFSLEDSVEREEGVFSLEDSVERDPLDEPPAELFSSEPPDEWEDSKGWGGFSSASYRNPFADQEAKEEAPPERRETSTSLGKVDPSSQIGQQPARQQPSGQQPARQQPARQQPSAQQPGAPGALRPRRPAAPTSERPAYGGAPLAPPVVGPAPGPPPSAGPGELTAGPGYGGAPRAAPARGPAPGPPPSGPPADRNELTVGPGYDGAPAAAPARGPRPGPPPGAPARPTKLTAGPGYVGAPRAAPARGPRPGPPPSGAPAGPSEVTAGPGYDAPLAAPARGPAPGAPPPPAPGPSEQTAGSPYSAAPRAAPARGPAPGPPPPAAPQGGQPAGQAAAQRFSRSESTDSPEFFAGDLDDLNRTMEVDPLDSSVRRSSGSHVRRVSQSERRRRSELDESTETPIVLPGRPSGSDFGDFGTADEVIDLPPEDVVESHRMPRSRPRPLGPSDAELGALSGPREADSDSFYLESPSESAWEAFRSDDMVDPHAGPLQPLSEGWSAAAAPPPPRPRALSRSSGFKGPTIDLHGSESVPSLPLAEAGASQGIFSESLLTSDSREPNFPSEDAPDDPEWRRLDESFEGTFPSAESWEGLALPQEASQSVAQRMGNLWSGEGLWLLLTVGGALLGPLLIWAGWQYYSLADSARPNHSLHRLLNANRPIGLWAGIVGSVLFVANLTYVLRRRFGFLSKLVSMRAWLNWHMVFGVTGGSLILVHSGLLAGNLVARISAAAIFVAIVSGLFGRYFLAHVPRRQEGDTADRAELAALLGELRGDLRKRLAPYPKLRAAALEALSAAEEQGDEEQGFFAIMLDMVLGPIRRRAREQLLAQRFRKLLDMEASADPELEELLEEVLDLLYLHGRLHRRLSQFEGVQDLMDTWRGLHMILALVMLATMFVHIAIAIQYGNLKFF